MTIYELNGQLYGSHFKNACAILGDDSFMDIVREAEKLMLFPNPQPVKEDFIRVGGHKVYSNHRPGTRGCWIAEEEEVKTIINDLKAGLFNRNYTMVIGPGATVSHIPKS